MDKRYNLYNFEASFKKFLIAENVSPITLKNYLSDLRHFLGWLIFKLKAKNQNSKIEEAGLEQILNFIDVSLVEEYKNYLVSNSIPIKTVNRRLSTLRKFFSFCINQGWIEENPAKKVQNLNLTLRIGGQNDNLKIKMDSMINSFASDLQKEKLNQDAIKSYLEVVQEFLSL